MFGLENLDGWKLLVLALVGIFIFGPDRLPKAISDGVKMIRGLRDMARNATSDLSRELGTDIQLEDLNPKALIRKHLLSEDDERALRKPLEDLYRDVQSDLKGIHGDLKETAEAVNSGGTAKTGTVPASAEVAKRSYDEDAT
jgi:sec-independent protein translocase protein TatB